MRGGFLAFKVRRAGEQADARGVGHNDGGPAGAGGAEHTGTARARLTRIPRAPQDGGQGRHGAGVFPAYRPADCRGLAD